MPLQPSKQRCQDCETFLHVSLVFHLLFALTQNLKGKMPMLQGDAGAGCASENACHWLVATKFTLQAPVGRILAQLASGTSFCYTFQKSLELGLLIVAAWNSKTVEEGLYFATAQSRHSLPPHPSSPSSQPPPHSPAARRGRGRALTAACQSSSPSRTQRRAVAERLATGTC